MLERASIRPCLHVQRASTCKQVARGYLSELIGFTLKLQLRYQGCQNHKSLSDILSVQRSVKCLIVLSIKKTKQNKQNKKRLKSYKILLQNRDSFRHFFSSEVYTIHAVSTRNKSTSLMCVLHMRVKEGCVKYD